MSPAAWGLCLNMAGTALAFFVGFPQPSHEEGVAPGLEPATPLSSGETVVQRDRRSLARTSQPHCSRDATAPLSPTGGRHRSAAARAVTANASGA